MDLTHEFTVPAGIDDTWATITDIASVATCFPGAVVTGVEDDSFEGSVKVKLGPIALVYNGAGEFTEKDEGTHTMKIVAKGKDKRGNGTAGANVDLTMTEGDGGTTVLVVTDLAITGKPAQFGRGVIEDVSDKLLGQFVDCLRQRMTAPPEAEESEVASTNGVQPSQDPGTAADEKEAAASSVDTPNPPTPLRPSVQADDSLDLGATVLPIILKSYSKQIVAGLGVLLLLAWLLRRRRS
ncbi:SRPBCC family protein [Nocardioides alcanivorans]|uniref:SRPBCC family protein n=1 Tax=Nocardioides alcanivorans TaxID=2897352 RepID=UPI001F45CF34|nr:SRPBCC family protein [Nocardioides alcanivorans]